MTDDPSGKRPRRFPPVLTRLQIVVLAILIAAGVAFLLPTLRHSYWGAYLSGDCAADPRLPECGKIMVPIGWRGFWRR